MEENLHKMQSSSSSLLLFILLLLFALPNALDASLVFSKEEVEACGKIRIPQMTVTPSGVLLVAQCRNASNGGLLQDNMLFAKVVTKHSADGGKTWGDMQVLTPERGHSHGQVVYDRLRKRVLLQYQFHPHKDPELNSTLFQKISHDDGETWENLRDITEEVSQCNPTAPENMQVGTAGSKIQTSSGRIVFMGHAKGTACRWWTDDGGETFQTTTPYVGNEASVAEVSPGRLYMNMRGLSFAWKGNRTSFWSSDDGNTFTKPEMCPIAEDAPFGCSAGLVSDQGRLFLSEPRGPQRVGLVIHCSLDGGVTWPLNYPVGGAKDPAAYSAMRVIDNHQTLLVVYEFGSNFWAEQVPMDWCQR